MADRKQLGALVVGMESPGGAATPIEEEKPEDLKALHDEAMDDVFDALKAGDRNAFRKAFSSAVRVCNLAEQEGLYDEESDASSEE